MKSKLIALLKRIRILWRDYCQAAQGHKISKPMKWLLFPHYLYCYRTVHCGAAEYFEYRFYKISQAQRKKYLLVYHQRVMYGRVNQKGATRSKIAFAQRFPSQFGRAFLDLRSCDLVAFETFFRTHKKIVIKPDNASYGRDISVFEFSDSQQAAEIFAQYGNNEFICEEFIHQHPVLQALNPHAVNTLRVLVLQDEDETKIIAAALRTGNGTCVVDNLKHSGIGANINVETGIVDTIGKDYAGKTYDTHPNTGVPFRGLQIPFWQQVLDLIRDVHPKVTECAVLGWDIAITEDGPVIVEANNGPGPMIHQYIDRVPRCEELVRFLEKRSNA